MSTQYRGCAYCAHYDASDGDAYCKAQLDESGEPILLDWQEECTQPEMKLFQVRRYPNATISGCRTK